MDRKEQAIAARLGDTVGRLRRTRSWSQAVLAERLDISEDYVSLLERGLRMPALPVVVSIAELFGVGLDLLVGTEPREEKWIEEMMSLLRVIPADTRNVIVIMVKGLVGSIRPDEVDVGKRSAPESASASRLNPVKSSRRTSKRSRR